MNSDECSAHSMGNCRECKNPKFETSCIALCNPKSDPRYSFAYESGILNSGNKLINVKTVTKYMERNQCKRDRPLKTYYYPGMCEQHGIYYKMQDYWEPLSTEDKNLILLLLMPTSIDLIVLPAYLQMENIPMDQAIYTMISPCGFWALTPKMFATLIILGTIHIMTTNNLNETAYVPEIQFSSNQTYIYILDYICINLLPWLMNGGENLVKIGLTETEMRMLKWNKLSHLLYFGFGWCFSPDNPRILPSFTFQWKQLWQDRIMIWLDLYIKEQIFDDDTANESILFFKELLNSMDFIASTLSNIPKSIIPFLKEDSLSINQ
jgi:hypothetical protein